MGAMGDFVREIRTPLVITIIILAIGSVAYFVQDRPQIAVSEPGMEPKPVENKTNDESPGPVMPEVAT